jgi:hypothetical protein
MIALLAALALLLAPATSYPKRYTERILITGADRAGEITGEAAHVRLAVGPGPGNFVNGTPVTTGWIISDWLAEVEPSAAELPRYEVVFEVTVMKETPREKHERYVVTCVFDPQNRRGYVRLPARGEPDRQTNAALISRGARVEGHWFQATDEWTNAALAAFQTR